MINAKHSSMNTGYTNERNRQKVLAFMEVTVSSSLERVKFELIYFSWVGVVENRETCTYYNL